MQEEIEVSGFADFLDLWPTLVVVAEVCSVTPNRVRQWKHRNNVPPQFWRRLIDNLPEQGVEGFTMDDLFDFVES